MWQEMHPVLDTAKVDERSNKMGTGNHNSPEYFFIPFQVDIAQTIHQHPCPKEAKQHTGNDQTWKKHEKTVLEQKHVWHMA